MSICNCCYYQNKCFYSILFYSIFKYISDAFDQSEVFPDLMKIAIVSPVFKTGDTTDISNYGLTFCLPRFSKILERVMYSSLYKHLTDQKILHPQQSGFRKDYSTEHAVAQLVDQIYESFENENFTIDLPKPFNTVNHRISLKNLEIYGIAGENLAKFRSYLTIRKHYL